MKRKIVLLVLVPILLFSIVLGTGNVEKKTAIANTSNTVPEVLSGSGESDGVDWWPMFHHDLARTGYSTSKAPKTNNTLWSSAVDSEAKEVWSPAVADGRVYASSRNGYLNCLNESTGEQIWSVLTWSPTCPAVANGRVYSGSWMDGSLHCLNASTGEQIWTAFNMSEDFFFEYSSPAVFDDKVYIGSNNRGNLYCFNALTGERIWTFYSGSGYFSSPAVVDGKVYAKRSGTTFCFDASTGEQIWSYFHGANSVSSPAVAMGRVYVPVAYGSGKLDCLNASTGELLWEYEAGDYYSSPAVADGRVYVGLGNRINCLNASTGQKLWEYTTGGPIGMSSPAVAGAQVYITSTDGRLYCLNALTGDFIWAYALGTMWEMSSGSPAVADGKLYSGSGNGKVYCFGGHDVAVVDASPSSAEAYAGDTIDITVAASNEGTFNETFSVSVYYDSTLIGTQAIVDLAQDTEVELNFSWDTTGIGGGYYTLSANASIVSGETNTTNNIFTDGVVKITSPVKISEVIPCNQTGYPKDTFKLGTLAFFKVTINSTALILQNTLITINLYDNASATISLESFQALITPGTSTIIFGLSVPATATIGTATVYACAYTDWPSQGGFPHCPEVSATLEITGS